MPALNRRKGAPLAALAGVLLVWVGVRAFLWQSPFQEELTPAALEPLLVDNRHTPAPEPFTTTRKEDQAVDRTLRNMARPAIEAVPIQPGPLDSVSETPISKIARIGAVETPSVDGNDTASAFAPPNVRPTRGPAAPAGNGPSAGPHPEQPNFDRWSFDGWLFVRPDTAAPNAAGPLPASYGASQVGGVLRYRLSRTSDHKPNLYVRATSALSGDKEAELAAGFAARPIASIPISVQAEARLSDIAGRREIRPAVLAVTELPYAKLPLGFQGEAYAQGGYVGGDFSTPFADGQAKIDRAILELGGAELRVGGGVWGGAQKGAARVDVGPTASVRFDIEDVPIRLSADYRHRVAGDAVPQSGIAFTLSTGF